MVQKFYDELAYGMEKVLADEEYQKIFAKPKIKTASVQVKEPVKLSADGITDTFNTIVTLSAMLDDMGYSRSAAQLLRVAQEIRDEVRIDEFEPGDKESDQYFAGLNPEGESERDLDNLLRELGEEKKGDPWDLSADNPKHLPDLGDAMDKPSNDDQEEGNPEC